MNILCAGEQLTLCPERALYWPARRTLLVADTHFGKDEIFRRAGRPIPEGMSAQDLHRLTQLLTQYEALRLVVLGDFFHGAPMKSEQFRAEFAAWLSAHPRLKIDIVAGNHDRHGGSGAWPERLCWQREPYLDTPFVLTHQVRGCEPEYALGGHVHPVLQLHSRSGDRARLPVFWFGARHAVLPAFGSFTGGAPIRPQAGDRLFAIAESAIIQIDRFVSGPH
jgi:DNA ligase-associated metallophosphoesterase